jgi:hypothetical protein
MARICVTVAAVAMGALVATSVGSGAESVSRIIDRTVVCRMVDTGFPDPIRLMRVSASPRNQTYDLPPTLEARNGPTGETGVRASMQTGPDPWYPTGYLQLSRTGCTTTTLRLPLSRRGLTGGPTGPSAKPYACDVPARVLIRVRAVFMRPTRFARDPQSPWLSIARGTISTGYLAVATMPGRKPFFFSAANYTTGKARLFVAPSRCRAEP